MKRRIPFATITNGKLHILYYNNFSNPDLSVPLDEEGNQKLAEFLWTYRIESLSCSSSIDFPEEDGVPEGFNAHEFIANAWDRVVWA